MISIDFFYLFLQKSRYHIMILIPIFFFFICKTHFCFLFYGFVKSKVEIRKWSRSISLFCFAKSRFQFMILIFFFFNCKSHFRFLFYDFVKTKHEKRKMWTRSISNFFFYKWPIQIHGLNLLFFIGKIIFVFFWDFIKPKHEKRKMWSRSISNFFFLQSSRFQFMMKMVTFLKKRRFLFSI